MIFCRNKSAECFLKSTGAIFFILSFLIFVAYLLFIEDSRKLLESLLGVEKCGNVFLESVIDSVLGYSLVANILLSVKPSRYTALSWLIIYGLNIIILVSFMCFSLYLCWILTLSFIAILILFLVVVALCISWACVFARYQQLASSSDYSPRIKFIVQVTCGALAFMSSVTLFVDVLSESIHPELLKKKELFFSAYLPFVSSSVAMSLLISINLLVIIGSNGARWRRSLLLPWLLFGAIMIILCFCLHQWLTTHCWVKEKLYGLVFLLCGTGLVVLWSAVWCTAAHEEDEEIAL